MPWVWIVVGIAVVGLVVIASYARWLYNKFTDVLGEVAMLGKRTEELADLVARVQLSRPAAGSQPTLSPAE